MGTYCKIKVNPPQDITDMVYGWLNARPSYISDLFDDSDLKNGYAHVKNFTGFIDYQFCSRYCKDKTIEYWNEHGTGGTIHEAGIYIHKPDERKYYDL